MKSIACELPWKMGVPLSRFSTNEIAREVVQRGIVADLSGATVWRWLHEDALSPWRHRSWIFPRDPDFEEKAGRVLDLYQGLWEGVPLQEGEYVISADEKTSIQARIRLHPTQPPGPTHRCLRVEHEYERGGALTYLAAWDVRRARVFGRCEKHSGIAAFDRLVAQVMTQEPYASAKRVFWIVDNGSSHRGQTSIQRLQTAYPHLLLVHLPVHASWLNQIEIYFSVVQRKVLTPNDFESLEDVAQRLLHFEQRYQVTAKRFDWKFRREDLAQLLKKLSTQSINLPLAA